jgi:hypothetical protein
VQVRYQFGIVEIPAPRRIDVLEAERISDVGRVQIAFVAAIRPIEKTHAKGPSLRKSAASHARSKRGDEKTRCLSLEIYIRYLSSVVGIQLSSVVGVQLSSVVAIQDVEDLARLLVGESGDGKQRVRSGTGRAPLSAAGTGLVIKDTVKHALRLPMMRRTVVRRDDEINRGKPGMAAVRECTARRPLEGQLAQRKVGPSSRVRLTNLVTWN